MQVNTKSGALVTLVVLGVVYALMISKGQKPPAAMDQVLVAAAGALFIARDKEQTK